MKKLSFRAIAALVAPVFFLMGCETRSISDSGYRGRFAWESGNRYYRGELNEMDVLGTPAGQKVTETDIQKALAAGGTVHVHPGDSLLVIQSGAIARWRYGRRFEPSRLSGPGIFGTAARR